MIRTLQRIDERLKELNDSLHDTYAVERDRTLIKFYMKGGNAFTCVQAPNGPNATARGGGDSYWDTQIVVDPWAPLPIQNRLYSVIQEIVMEEVVRSQGFVVLA